MAANRVLCIYSVAFLFIINRIFVFVRADDSFTEELFIKSLERGHVLNHFQFTTVWNSSVYDLNTFTHYRLFPKALGDVLSTYKVQELHLSQTQGLWNYEHWGYQPEDAPPGVELWVWFQPDAINIDHIWTQLVNALSGLFCSSLNFMDSKVTVTPKWSFRPWGVAPEYYNVDSRFVRFSALPHEIVCTENLTPWKKLLPCESEAGLAKLLNAVKLYDSSFHSLGVHFRPVCQNSQCSVTGIELRQTLTAVFNPTLTNSGKQKGYQNWSIRSMFERSLSDTCPMASVSKVYVDTTIHPPPQLTLTPEPDEISIVKRGGEKCTIAVYDLKKLIATRRVFALQGTYNIPVLYSDSSLPPLYAHRYITGYGLEKGGITCTLYNTLDTNLTVMYMDILPWYLRVYFSSIKIESYGIKVKPYKTHFIPGKDRSRPHQLEIIFRLRPQSVTHISMEFDRAFLKWTEYPPDANHGFYVNSAVITTILPSGSHYTAVPQNVSIFGERFHDNSTQFFLRLHTESLLVSLPTPDFSMPYNVICLACTVVAIAFGSLHNLTTRSLVAIDPEQKKPNILQKLKDFFKKGKKEADRKDVNIVEGTNEVEDDVNNGTR